MSNDNVIFLSNVRLSFPNLVEPQRRVSPEGKERVSYNAEFLMDQDHPGFVQFMKKYGELALEKWKEHANQVMQIIQQDRKLRCYGSGSEKVNQKTFQVYDGYEGKVYISTGRDTQPQMIDATGNPIDPANTMACQAVARKLYGGCYVNAAVKPWLQENKHGRGVRCDLIAVQFHAEGAAFGEGAVDVTGMFGASQAQPTGQPTSSPADAQVPAASIPGLPPFMS
jgi:hypothetical protein